MKTRKIKWCSLVAKEDKHKQVIYACRYGTKNVSGWYMLFNDAIENARKKGFKVKGFEV